MIKKSFKSELILLIAAIVWGFTFVAQKVGMDSIGPMAFNGIRFLIGSIALVPVLIFYNDKSGKPVYTSKNLLTSGILSGLVMFFAASLQQIGIVYTNAGNAGFIASFYVILVPIFGLIFFKEKVSLNTWIAVIIAFAGLYFLSVKEELIIVKGDFFVLISTFFWAFQVLLAGYYAKRFHIIKLAAIQFAITGILSITVSLFTETYGWQNINNALIPILYGGLISVGLAFTLQLIAQQKANPSHAAIILSMECVFAALGGWLMLDETFTIFEKIGAFLLLIAVIISQLTFGKKKLRLYHVKAKN